MKWLRAIFGGDSDSGWCEADHDWSPWTEGRIQHRFDSTEDVVRLRYCPKRHCRDCGKTDRTFPPLTLATIEVDWTHPEYALMGSEFQGGVPVVADVDVDIDERSEETLRRDIEEGIDEMKSSAVSYDMDSGYDRGFRDGAEHAKAVVRGVLDGGDDR